MKENGIVDDAKVGKESEKPIPFSVTLNNSTVNLVLDLLQQKIALRHVFISLAIYL